VFAANFTVGADGGAAPAGESLTVGADGGAPPGESLTVGSAGGAGIGGGVFAESFTVGELTGAVEVSSTVLAALVGFTGESLTVLASGPPVAFGGGVASLDEAFFAPIGLNFIVLLAFLFSGIFDSPMRQTSKKFANLYLYYSNLY
jgi:hypothetical protein